MLTILVSLRLEEEGEWACRCSSLHVRAQVVLFKWVEHVQGFWTPLRLIAEVVVVALVAEEEMLVTPERRGELRGRDNCADEFFFTTETLWLVHGVDKVQDGASLDHLQSVEDVHCVVFVVV